MAIRAGCGARLGCGCPSPRGEHAMPRLRNALRVCSAGPPMRLLRIAAARRSRCTRHIVNRSCRLRRVLCHRREARAAGTRRPTGHRRRRRARSRSCLLLCVTALRRAVGDADVQGAGRLPCCGRDPPGHGQISRGRTRRAHRAAEAHAAGRTGVDRRGVPRSLGHRKTVRCGTCSASRHACPKGRIDAPNHPVDRLER